MSVDLKLFQKIYPQLINYSTSFLHSSLEKLAQHFLKLKTIDHPIFVNIVLLQKLLDFYLIAGLTTHPLVALAQKVDQLLGIEYSVLVDVVLNHEFVHGLFDLFVSDAHDVQITIITND